MDLTLQGLPSEPESRISCSVHAVYADCMQSVHHAAVHAAVQWAEEKLSINLQHFIPLQSSADCSESLQIMWEHNTLSLNFHLIISWVRSKMKNFHVFFNISNLDSIFLGLLPGSILQFCIHFKTLQRVHCIHAAAASASKVFSI